MSQRSHLTHTPLQAMARSIVSAAASLRSNQELGTSDILTLTPETVCRNAVAMLRDASPLLEGTLLTVGPFVVLGYGIYRYVWSGLSIMRLIEHIRERFAAKVTVPGDHALSDQIIAWMSSQNLGTNTRALTLHGPCRQDAGGSLSSLSYVLAAGTSSLKFQGHQFTIERGDARQVQVYNSYGDKVGNSTRTQKPDIVITNSSLFGSVEPIKAFLEHVKAAHDSEKASKISIYRVAKHNGYEPRSWDNPVLRQSRKLNSVAIDEDKKESLVRDVERYLSDSSKLWYANRGIPHRRGYLFYGPPGTGKTSFSTALAGQFNLPAYILTLSDRSLNDTGLEELFDDLPAKCLVLLEDVDSAGIQRENMSRSGGKKPRMDVTLSGLLNVIDGPCSFEGRVLVLTSNSPDSLDAALLRPGRIDLKVLFGNASREVMEKLFMHVFGSLPGEETSTESPHDLALLSKAFASKIPEDALTPAEIQSFLLMRRDNPPQAVTEVEGWAAGVIATKSKGCNVSEFDGQIDVNESAPTTEPASIAQETHVSSDCDKKSEDESYDEGSERSGGC